MAVTAYNADFNKQQAALEKRERDRANGWGGNSASAGIKQMNAEQLNRFQNSNFMKQSQQIDETVKQILEDRSKKMMQLDRSWLPKESDWTAPKSYKYDKYINYYGVLGLQDMATQEDIKQAYKRLSLVYHPDKTAGMKQEKKDDYSAIFIELKNAYTTLMDNPTRRQYDAERVREYVMAEVSGTKMKERKQFWGYEMHAEKTREKEEKLKGPSITVDIPVPCRLEKFAWGGHKCMRRQRRVQIRGEWLVKDKEHHILVPAGAKEPLEAVFWQKGDEREDTMPDTLRYLLSSKPHERVERSGEQDLRLKTPCSLGSSAGSDPYFSTAASSVNGNYVLVWGRNPFWKNAGTGKVELRIEVRGLGLGQGGSLHFLAQPGADRLAEKGKIWEVVGGGNTGGILVREGEDVSSPKAAARLSTGAIVEPLKLVGERLHYKRLSGTGPETGWVSIRLPGKELVVEKGTVWEVAECTDNAGVEVRTKKEAGSPKEAARLGKGSTFIQLEKVGDNVRYQLMTGSGPQTGWISVGAAASSNKSSGGAPPGAALLATAAKDVKHIGMRKRVLRQMEKVEMSSPICEVKLDPFGSPVPLFTNPGCSIQFYSNLGQPASEGRPGFVRPRATFALVVSSPACSKKKAAADWTRLLQSLPPLLEATAFKCMEACRRILPKSLATAPAFSNDEYGKPADAASKEVPWDRLADEAWARGDPWLASTYYTQALERLAHAEQPQQAAHLLCYRADCYSAVGDHNAALADGERAAELAPTWARPRSIVGQAYQKGSGVILRRTEPPSDAEGELPEPALMEGSEAYSKALEAYTEAVVLESSSDNIGTLHAIASCIGGQSAEEAAREREKGNEAMRDSKLGLAVAAYTTALARMPPPADAEKAKLWAALYGNRSAAFCRLCDWGAAVADGYKAVEAKADLPKAHVRLAVALLGSGMVEKAYQELSEALKLEEGCMAARQLQNTVLLEMLQMKSRPAQARQGRMWMDAGRPKGTTRVFALSDVHFDQKINEEWCHGIDSSKFQEDVLILAGGVAETFDKIVRGLTTLKGKFRRVFYVPGSSELWITPNEKSRFPDSFTKLCAIWEVCDAIGIDLGPAMICQDTYLVPLMSWYNAEFDEKDPLPNGNVDFDPMCSWPIDKYEQVWRYMAKMNEPNLAWPYHGTVMTFSHVLPHRGLPFWEIGEQVKFIGCQEIDEQARKLGCNLHVYGRAHRRAVKEFDGVTYVHMPLGKWDERTEEVPPVSLVFDGHETCAKQWGIWDAPFQQ